MRFILLGMAELVLWRVLTTEDILSIRKLTPRTRVRAMHAVQDTVRPGRKQPNVLTDMVAPRPCSC
jgi:hypothetical protein